jgi:predicted transcriptional regulator of viral defense system
LNNISKVFTIDEVAKALGHSKSGLSLALGRLAKKGTALRAAHGYQALGGEPRGVSA